MYMIRLSFFLIVLGTCLLPVGFVRAEVEAVDVPAPRRVVWETTAVTATMYHVEASHDLTSTSAWKAAAQVVATGPVMSANLNVTNDLAFFRVTAVTSRFPVTRHEMVLVPESTYLMGSERTSWWTTIYSGTSYVQFAAFPSELPRHSATVSSFLIDKFEVTNEKLAETFQWAYTNNLVDIQPTVVTSRFWVQIDTNWFFVTNVTTNTLSRVVNREGTTQSLFRVDLSWSEVIFTNGQFTVLPTRTNFPVTGITWFGALAYANYRSDMEGLPRAVDFAPSNWSMNINVNGYRLPTEAEWEKAARGGVTNTLYPWPNDSVQGTNNYQFSIDHFKANYIDPRFGSYTNQPRHPWWNLLTATTPVGYYNGQQVIATNHTAKPPESGADAWQVKDMANPYGLYDMAGNVYEWCWDWRGTNWYGKDEASQPDTLGESNSMNALIPGTLIPARVLRGGGWKFIEAGIFSAPDASFLRCAYREAQAPGTIYDAFGFRLVRSIR